MDIQKLGGLDALQELSAQSKNHRDELSNKTQYSDDKAPFFISSHLVRLRLLVCNLNLTVLEYAVIETAIVKYNVIHFMLILKLRR